MQHASLEGLICVISRKMVGVLIDPELSKRIYMQKRKKAGWPESEKEMW